MTEKEKKEIENSVLKIIISMVEEISSDDVILSLNQDNSVLPDPVSNHHLIEVLSLLDNNIFSYYINRLFKWLASPQNNYSQHPFTLDSYTNITERNEDNDHIFYDLILSSQQNDGSIPIYTALFMGGDFFSTLWALKILIKYDKVKFKNQIELGINYLIQKRETSPRLISQKGFFLYILLLYSYKKYENIANVIAIELIENIKNIHFNGNLLNIIDELYLIEDVLEYSKENIEYQIIIENKIIELFTSKKGKNRKTIFEKFKDYKPQSPYYQMSLIAVKLYIKYLKYFKNENIKYTLNAIMHNQYLFTRYIGLSYEKELKIYKQQFEEAKISFNKYDEELVKMWEKTKSQYENSIFLMMPFKDTQEYRTIAIEIKRTCEKYNLKAFKLDDEYRRPYEILWENIILNILACKYGISIYTSDKVIDQIDDDIKFFHNPNVALEFGLMKSRGKKVLILKDKKSILPSDLQGFIWKSFDLKNPDRTISNAITSWIEEYIIPKEKK
jgi:predicted nucleotide-binding protein